MDRIDLPGNFLALNCNELKQFAQANFNYKLQGEKAAMQAQVKALVDSHNAAAANPSRIEPDNRIPEKVAGIKDIDHPTIHPAAAPFLKNPITGVVWPATEQLRKIPGMVPCIDADGTPLNCLADTDAIIDNKLREERQRIAAALNISDADLTALIEGRNPFVAKQPSEEQPDGGNSEAAA